MKTFTDAMIHRRSYYSITNTSPISDAEIEKIIENAILHVPSAFNSQSTRVILLLADQHKKLWDITKETLKAITTPEAFKATEAKIDSCFKAGYGTILFFEDTEVIESLQKQFATYSDNFPLWSQQTSGMHQFAIWTMLEDAGLGATLQHYNPLIDEKVQKEWNINKNWKLITQMPFGTPAAEPGEKEFKPVKDRFITYK